VGGDEEQYCSGSTGHRSTGGQPSCPTRGQAELPHNRRDDYQSHHPGRLSGDHRPQPALGSSAIERDEVQRESSPGNQSVQHAGQVSSVRRSGTGRSDSRGSDTGGNDIRPGARTDGYRRNGRQREHDTGQRRSRRPLPESKPGRDRQCRRPDSTQCAGHAERGVPETQVQRERAEVTSDPGDRWPGCPPARSMTLSA
jgi:hypothetical protein